MGAISKRLGNLLVPIIFLAVAGLVFVGVLFYPWLDKHEGSGTWAQAATGLGTIVCAIWVAYAGLAQGRSESEKKQRNLQESVAVHSGECLDAYDNFIKELAASPHPDFVVANYPRASFATPLADLSAFAPHELGDSRLVIAVGELKRLIARTIEELDNYTERRSIAVNRINETGWAGLIPAFSIDGLRNYRGVVFNAHASVQRIVHGVAAEAELSRKAATP